MDEFHNSKRIPLSSQKDRIKKCISLLKAVSGQEKVEDILTRTFEAAPDSIAPDSDECHAVLNYHIYRYILKYYKHKEPNICLWRFVKNLSRDQLTDSPHPQLKMTERLIRVYFYSDPLDDLTCIFVPISNKTLIKKYLDWIRSCFYNEDYPTSLLWLYALDSSLFTLFPDEIICLGTDAEHGKMIPDFNYPDTVLIKRFSDRPDHYIKLEGKDANNEFRQIFTFLKRESKDRCLSRSGSQDAYPDRQIYKKEWEKFEDVLRFGVSDKNENGCISFSDMRASTEFLSAYGKNVYLNKIQQPFFEQTKLISEKYNGRIDKFMGDNVMSVFLTDNMLVSEENAEDAVINNFFALFELCKTLSELIAIGGWTDAKLGLRSGVAYGSRLLRSNLGNEILRDFTVTGETVNLAARLEHISIRELFAHNRAYFKKSVERFPQISQIIQIKECCENLSPETEAIAREFTLYQNILSNLEKLETAKFDIRSNQNFYFILRTYLEKKGYKILNPQTSEMYGYEEYDIKGFHLRFYFSYYNPKGFNNYEKIWILPLESEILKNFELEIDN